MTAPKTPIIPPFPSSVRPVLVMEPELMPRFRRVGAPFSCVADVPWTDVAEALRRAPATTLVVVDPYAGVRYGDRFPRVRDLLRRFPSVPVVAVVDLLPFNAPDVTMLMEWGVSDLAPRVHESTPHLLARRLEQAHVRPFKRALEATLSKYVNSDAREVLMAAAEVAAEGGLATELRARLRIAESTLTLRCGRADLPPPRYVQSWMRLLLACMLLDDPGRTVYGAAYASGYQTDRSLRRAITAMLGVDSTSLRRTGAFRMAASAFNGVLRDAREAARERRREELLAAAAAKE
jgi:methylphosphotriester-DNA--protein-cysteine methyltransferase